MSESRLEISLPHDPVERLDEVIEFLDFGIRNAFAEAAVRKRALN